MDICTKTITKKISAKHEDSNQSNQSNQRNMPIVDQYMCWPPLIDKVEPVMKSDASAVKNNTPRAMSSALPRRPAGIR